MEVRKLQTTAGGTFIVTIPREWAERLKLSKGDLVSIELEENDLVMSPTKSRMGAQSRSLGIDQFKDQRLLELCITASYIQGHDITEIVSKGKMAPEQKRWIRQAVESLIGVEIAEDYASQVVLQNLVDPTKFDLNKSLERFSTTAKAVFSDAIRALAENDRALAQDAYERGDESTRLYRLLMRLALQAAVDKSLRAQMNLPNVSSVIVRIIAIRELGRIAYYAMRIAQHVGEIEKRLDEETISIIQKMTRTTLEMQDQAISALLNRNLALAPSVIDKMAQVRRLYETAHASMLKIVGEKSLLAFSLIIRDIRAIAGYTVALADDAVLGVFA